MPGASELDGQELQVTAGLVSEVSGLTGQDAAPGKKSRAGLVTASGVSQQCPTAAHLHHIRGRPEPTPKNLQRSGMCSRTWNNAAFIVVSYRSDQSCSRYPYLSLHRVPFQLPVSQGCRDRSSPRTREPSPPPAHLYIRGLRESASWVAARVRSDDSTAMENQKMRTNKRAKFLPSPQGITSGLCSLTILCPQ